MEEEHAISLIIDEPDGNLELRSRPWLTSSGDVRFEDQDEEQSVAENLRSQTHRVDRGCLMS